MPLSEEAVRHANLVPAKRKAETLTKEENPPSCTTSITDIVVAGVSFGVILRVGGQLHP